MIATGFTKQTATHPHLQNISSDLHELRNWSSVARGEQLLHLLHTPLFFGLHKKGNLSRSAEGAEDGGAEPRRSGVVGKGNLQPTRKSRELSLIHI